MTSAAIRVDTMYHAGPNPALYVKRKVYKHMKHYNIGVVVNERPK